MKLSAAIVAICLAIASTSPFTAAEEGHPALLADFFKGVCDLGTCETVKTQCIESDTKTELECAQYYAYCIQHLCSGRPTPESDRSTS